MAMKKTSGGDSPLRQVPGRASGPSRSSGRRRRRIAMYSGKLIGPLGFSRQGVYIGERMMSEGVPRPLTRGWRGQGGGRAAPVSGAHVAPLRQVFGYLGASP